VSRRLEQELGRDPTNEELAHEMALTSEQVREIVKISQVPLSLEMPIGVEDETHLGDFVEDKEATSPMEAALVSMLRIEVEFLQRALGITATAGPMPVASGVLVASVSGEVLLVDRRSGTILWRVQLDGPIEQPPLVRDRQLVIVAGRGDIRAYR